MEHCIDQVCRLHANHHLSAFVAHEGGFSYIVVGANAADALAPVVAELTGH